MLMQQKEMVGKEDCVGTSNLFVQNKINIQKEIIIMIEKSLNDYFQGFISELL